MEHEDIVQRAFTAIDNDFKDSWAYTEESMRDDSVFLASYDPRRPENRQWELVSVDDRDPSSEELESFLARKLDQSSDETDEDHRLEKTIQPDTLTLLEETSEHWLFSFVPAEDDDGDEFMQHVDGILKVVKDGHYVEYFDLRNKAPFKPAIGVKVKAFTSRLTFGPATAEGPIVPKSIDVSVQGRAYLAVKFDETEKIRFLNYEYVGGE